MKKTLPLFLFLLIFSLKTSILLGQTVQKLGCTLDEQKFKETYIYARLAGSEKLPAKASLLQYAPKRGNQGEQGSCVGWASAYAAYSIIYAAANGTDPNQNIFSPAYVFNQIAINSACDGSYIYDALDLMKLQGLLPLSDFPYNDGSCNMQPTDAQRKKAGEYKILGYNRLTTFADAVDMQAVKQNLSKGSPVVIGMPVGGSFLTLYGEALWQPSSQDYADMRYFGGHAMCVIGYDDTYAGGAFQIMNSWGVNWGENGVFWLKYSDFEQFCFEAYGIDPLPKQVKNDDNQVIDFRVKIALLANETGDPIPLERKGNYLFGTINKQNIGTKFKIGIDNSIACYAYVLAEETNGEAYILFPYTEKHSAYFGITGKRIFPEDYSMRLDEIGNQDKMAILVSKNPINIYQLQNQINASSATTFEQKVTQALNSRVIQENEIQFRKSEIVMFEVLQNTHDIVPIFIQIDK